jgi:Cys-rich repeat protein
MSYLDQRPQPLIQPAKGIIRARPIILAIVFVVVVIVIVIVLLLLTAPKSSSSSKCTSNAGCSGLAAVCNTVTGICVECLTNTDCPSGQECITGNSCSAITCTSDSNCSASAPKCNTGNGVCVECLVPADCPIMGSNCNTNGVCIAPCTGAPNPVTGVTVTGETGTNIVTWNAPTGGQVVSDYVVNQEANICSSTVGPIIATKIVPAGTTTTAFTNLNQGFYCYRVQSQNGCGSTPIGSSPDNNGVVCGNLPDSYPDAFANYKIDPSCTSNYSPQFQSSQYCPCSLANGCQLCDSGGNNCMLSCNGLVEQCPSDCTGPFCPSSNTSTTCQVDITWSGPYPGASQLVIFTRQNVTNQQAGITLEDSEATLPFNMSSTGFLPGTKSWYQQCDRTSVVTNISVTAATETAVTFPADAANGATVSLGAGPKIGWEPVSGADEYAILVFNEGLSYGTLVSAALATVNTDGTLSYMFLSPPAVTGASVHVYAYSYCFKSEPSSGTSVSS